jgi:hypothetical protein
VVADERARARPQVHVVFAEANVGFALQAQNEHQPIVTVANQAASARQAAGRDGGL